MIGFNGSLLSLIRANRRERRRERQRRTRRREVAAAVSVAPEELPAGAVSAAAYWRRIGAPLGLNVSGSGGAAALDRATSAKRLGGEVWRQGERLAQLQAQIKRDGFVSLAPSELCCDARAVAALRRGALRLTALGWPATMLLLFDEEQLLLGRTSRLVPSPDPNPSPTPRRGSCSRTPRG